MQDLVSWSEDDHVHRIHFCGPDSLDILNTLLLCRFWADSPPKLHRRSPVEEVKTGSWMSKHLEICHKHLFLKLYCHSVAKTIMVQSNAAPYRSNYEQWLYQQCKREQTWLGLHTINPSTLSPTSQAIFKFYCALLKICIMFMCFI